MLETVSHCCILRISLFGCALTQYEISIKNAQYIAVLWCILICCQHNVTWLDVLYCESYETHIWCSVWIVWTIQENLVKSRKSCKIKKILQSRKSCLYEPAHLVSEFSRLYKISWLCKIFLTLQDFLDFARFSWLCKICLTLQDFLDFARFSWLCKICLTLQDFLDIEMFS